MTLTWETKDSPAALAVSQRPWRAQNATSPLDWRATAIKVSTTVGRSPWRASPPFARHTQPMETASAALLHWQEKPAQI